MIGRRINDFDNFINANPGKMHSPRNLPLNLANFSLYLALGAWQRVAGGNGTA